MKLPPFDHGKMGWDAWKAFHVPYKYHTFIQFDTGEFVVRFSRWRPAERRIYPDFHLQVVGTDDKDCPALYIPGRDKPVVRHHLNHKGSQVLLLDLDHKRAVGLNPWRSPETSPQIPARFFNHPPWRLSETSPQIPARFSSHHIAAYYSGPDAMPAGAPIIRHYLQPLTRAERTHIRELTNACKVWLAMQPALEPAEQWRRNPGVKPNAAGFIKTPFSALTEDQRTAIAMHGGFDMTVREEHPYLTWKPEEKSESVSS